MYEAELCSLIKQWTWDLIYNVKLTSFSYKCNRYVTNIFFVTNWHKLIQVTILYFLYIYFISCYEITCRFLQINIIITFFLRNN